MEEREEALATQEPEQKEEWLEDAKRMADRRRSYILWLLGGAYLIYTSYNLIRGYVNGEEEVTMVLLLIGVAFGVTGVLLVINAVRSMMKLQKLQQAGSPASVGEEKKEQPEQPDQPAQPTRKRSIAERARLAQTLEEKEEETDG